MSSIKTKRNLVIKKLPLGVFLAVQSVENGWNEAPLHPLLALDMDQTSSNTLFKQRWVARQTLAHLLRYLNLPMTPLVKSSRGSPYLKHSHYYISFSHTPHRVAVALAPDPVGVDIEQPQERLLKLSRRFLTPQEQYAHGCLARLTLLWAAKESLYKLQGGVDVSPFAQIEISPFALAYQGVVKLEARGQAYQGYYEKIEGEGDLPDHFWVMVSAGGRSLSI